MSPAQPDRIVLHGYKSIRECDMELRNLNVLVGPNGAGKSNLLGFFSMMRRLAEGGLQDHVDEQGGPGELLHRGAPDGAAIKGLSEEDRAKELEKKRREDEQDEKFMDASLEHMVCTPDRREVRRGEGPAGLSAELHFGESGYRFALEPMRDGRLGFVSEALWGSGADTKVDGKNGEKGDGERDAAPGPETGYTETRIGRGEAESAVFAAIRNWRIYRFDDVGDGARIKQLNPIRDNRRLREDAGNLAAFLYSMRSRHPFYYERIVKTVQMSVALFDDFVLRPHPDNPDLIALEWKEKGRNEPLAARALSDGTLRHISLVALLTQPDESLPETIIIESPETDQSPYALAIVAGMLRSSSKGGQVIVSTQSADLLSEFDPEDVVVADRFNERTIFSRLNAGSLETWLEDFTLGELWRKNMLGGTAAYESRV